jgi:hypothetical protein
VWHNNDTRGGGETMTTLRWTRIWIMNWQAGALIPFYAKIWDSGGGVCNGFSVCVEQVEFFWFVLNDLGT